MHMVAKNLSDRMHSEADALRDWLYTGIDKHTPNISTIDAKLDFIHLVADTGLYEGMQGKSEVQSVVEKWLSKKYVDVWDILRRYQNMDTDNVEFILALKDKSNEGAETYMDRFKAFYGSDEDQVVETLVGEYQMLHGVLLSQKDDYMEGKIKGVLSPEQTLFVVVSPAAKRAPQWREVKEWLVANNIDISVF